MGLSRRIFLVATTTFALVSLGNTAPAPAVHAVSEIFKRSVSAWDSSCGDVNDPTSNRNKAGQALADAATLAAWTFDNQLGDGTAYTGTNAFVP